jgi:hypothetical protein
MINLDWNDASVMFSFVKGYSKDRPASLGKEFSVSIARTLLDNFLESCLIAS